MGSLYELSREELGEALSGEAPYRLEQLWRALWREDRTVAEMTTLPRVVRERLGAEYPSGLSPINEVVSDGGATIKWVFALHDGATIETVLMSYADRVTVCVSSQAGCAMGCSFCSTGQAGFRRHLSVGEVLEQVSYAARAGAPRRLSNVVFMGMGEPLANYEVTVRALRRLHQERGMSARHLTVSSVGVAPAIERLSEEGLALTLAVSLHAANDADRDALVPLNRRYDLARLETACRAWIERTGRRLSFEWALIDGINDTNAALGELADYARGLGAHVNLIPLNPTPGFLVRGSRPERVRAFRDGLLARGVNATVRDTRGRSIAAACGQLASVSGGRHGLRAPESTRVALRARA